MNSDIKNLIWLKNTANALDIMSCDLGPYRAVVMQGPVVSLNMNFVIGIINIHTNKTLYTFIKEVSYSYLLTVMGGNMESIMVSILDAAGLKLIEYYNNWVAEEILLGGHIED